MLILYLLAISIFYFAVKIILNLIVRKFGKLSYDGFSAAGFAYNSKKDIFYSTRNAWQKNFGYTHSYDVWAPIFRMIIDTQPIRFYYNNKNWLITFWKGQYGIVTGAEIGIYATKEKIVNKKTIYLPVNDDEMLDMELILYKKGNIITKVNAKHWWLAIFKLGMFSKPKELSMDIKLTFPNREMLEAFLNAFKKLKYKSKYYSIKDNVFYFNYIKPRTHKVWTRNFLFDFFTQRANRKNVKLYNKYLSDFIDDNYVDDSNNKKIIKLNDLLPDLIKNPSKDKENNDRIIKEIVNERENNVVLFLDDIYPRSKKNKL